MTGDAPRDDLDIQRVLYDYAWACDNGEWTRLSSVFTADAELAVFALNPLVSVVPASVLPDESPMWEEGAVKRIAEELHEWCRPLDEAGVSARTSVVRGTPFEVLERIADEEDAVMIVVGRSGRGGITEMLLGSVPHSLTHHAVRPVLVVPVR